MSDKIKKALEPLYAYVRDGSRDYYKDNIKELLKAAGKNKPKKALYSAAFLDEGSREDLYNWWKMHVQEDLLARIPKHSHMTIKFKPSEEDVLSIPVGEDEDKTVTIVGFANDSFGQAVQVRVSDSSIDRQDGGIAHITISASEDAPMGFAYSNELLSQGVEEVKSGPELSVKVGLFLTNGRVTYSLDGTVYQDESIELDL